MNARQRIAKIIKAMKPKDDIKYIWLERDEDGNFPPILPGEEVINLTWTGEDDPGAGDDFVNSSDPSAASMTGRGTD